MESEVEGASLAPESFSKNFWWHHVASRHSSVGNAAINHIGGNAIEFKPNADSNALGHADRADLKNHHSRGQDDSATRRRGDRRADPGRPVYQLRWTYRRHRHHMASIQAHSGVAIHRHDDFQQHIMVISTPNRDNAARYVGIEGIYVTG